MDNREESSAFLKSRRDRITPEQAGIAVYGQRRVPGLRRGEVAMLAGVSVEYYTRLERGNLRGVSDGVLDALAQALRLDDTERAHLYDLARAAGGTATARAKKKDAKTVSVRPSLARIIEGMPEQPAFIENNRLDMLAANPMGRALYAEMYAEPALGANTVRFAFFSPAARRFYADWERVTRTAVGALRVEAAKNPYDQELSNLIGELSTRSDHFRVLWGAQDVHIYREGTKNFHHPVVGDLTLHHERLDLPDDSRLSLVVYNAPPGSPAEDSLKLLASWAATHAQQEHEQEQSADADS
ncbi:helix-turn-helix transcriptional regulator [Streptomyces sp. NPDC001315]|uniref:helix-turn-helix transcriptional regulator n=1 Tax=Streptomyces sp. NPDC001315 TaxID=3364562 RepID=UPI0036961BFD